MKLKVMPNLKPAVLTRETHELDLPQCCPVSGNPQTGSKIEIIYRPKNFHLEVYQLKAYIQSFVGGQKCSYSGSVQVREMEDMIQTIAQDCAEALKVSVRVRANLILDGQAMKLFCKTGIKE